ncbi:MAG: Zn-dependent exopeptidase M28 [Candidatus Riflebacteria bacterium]|nr:Zn-dependent exopeptidase M28 [Candidatus Riflebacteria bacterium]
MSGKVSFWKIGILTVLFSTFCFVQAFALANQPKAELDEFIKNIKEENRVDQIGYLIQLEIPSNRINDDKVLSVSGKYFYSSDEGYITHVNYERLQNLIDSGISFKVLDKKRLNDENEEWLMVWAENDRQEKAIKLRFEPLYQHDHTTIIRIRPEDEDHLVEQGAQYKILDESLFPARKVEPGEQIKIKAPNQEIGKYVAMINKDSLLATVQKLQDFKSRYVNQPGNTSAVQWLTSEFIKIPGLKQVESTFSSNSGTLSNVVFEKTGTKDPKTIYVVCGHMDSIVTQGNKNFAPGADDNGTGAATVLEIARVLGTKELPYTVLFACMNAEEIGLVGSKALAKALASSSDKKVKACLNLDMLADNDDNQFALIGDTKSNWLIDVVKDAAKTYVNLDSKPLYDSKIWYSDHSSFWNIGVPANLSIEGYPEMSKFYHSVNDLVSNMAPSLMEKIARANLAALLIIDSVPASK